ncbi:hypothetical protein [Vibrio cholerae]|uniref:hypothetical protein n=1 Tax=Vibrio cholerae TaxID=666 RepID=UPI000E0BC3BD|nr:hypothetical protein [Vibrio cholerae]
MKNKVNSVKRAIGLEVLSEFLSDKSIMKEFMSELDDDALCKLRDDLSSILIERAKVRVTQNINHELSTEVLDLYKSQVIKAVAHINTSFSNLYLFSRIDDTHNSSSFLNDLISHSESISSLLALHYDSAEVVSEKKEVIKVLLNMATMIERNDNIDVEQAIRFKDALFSKLVAFNDLLSEVSHQKKESDRTINHLDIWCTVALEAVKTQIETDQILSAGYVDKLLIQRVSVEEFHDKSSSEGLVYRAFVDGQLKKWNGFGRPPRWYQDLFA